MNRYYVVSVEGQDELSKSFRFGLTATLYYSKMARKGFEAELTRWDWTTSSHPLVIHSTKWGRG